jgi:predicted nuclease with TOPRIM domain
MIVTVKLKKTPSNAKEFDKLQKLQQEEKKLREELESLNTNYEIERDYSSRVRRIEIERNQEFKSRIQFFKNHSRHYERIIGSWREIETTLENRIGNEDEDINFAERTLARIIETEDGLEFNEE